VEVLVLCIQFLKDVFDVPTRTARPSVGKHSGDTCCNGKLGAPFPRLVVPFATLVSARSEQEGLRPGLCRLWPQTGDHLPAVSVLNISGNQPS
jgi:hypothetical protein